MPSQGRLRALTAQVDIHCLDIADGLRHVNRSILSFASMAELHPQSIDSAKPPLSRALICDRKRLTSLALCLTGVIPASAMRYTLLIAFLLLANHIYGENWPQFRGPNAQGCSAEKDVPLRWTATENIAWKTAVPGEGWSSPVVWGETVVLTMAADSGKSCHVMALRADTGQLLWDTQAFVQEMRRKEGRNTYATPTPATDGQRVYACFNDGSFCALDFKGQVVWTNRAYGFYSQHGLGTSPVLVNDLLVMARDGSSDGEDKSLGWQKPWDRGYIVALDTRTGQERWKATRGLSRISHGAPALWKTADGRQQLVSEAGDVVQGFDPQTGKRLWSYEVIGEGKVPSVVVGNGLIFTAGGWGGRESIKAFAPGEGLKWERKGVMPKVPSMLVHEGLLYAVTDAGMASCLDATTGEIVWTQRLGRAYSASPVYAAGRVYFVGDNGETTVVAAGREFKLLATNPIGERVQASPAISGGRILIRTERNLFAIGAP